MARPHRGYPLGALFVLVTACAVLAAGIAPLVRLAIETTIDGSALLIVGCGAVSGIVMGIVIGLMQFNRGSGVIMGVGIGLILGTVAGAMAQLSTDQIMATAMAMTAGSGLIVVVAVVMRGKE